MKTIAAAVAALSLAALPAPASASPSAGANCVGRSVSYFGPVASGLLGLIASLGGFFVGEVARTHCDPSYD
jgi:hypothetical protein